jgi:hypothetical protein
VSGRPGTAAPEEERDVPRPYSPTEADFAVREAVNRATCALEWSRDGTYSGTVILTDKQWAELRKFTCKTPDYWPTEKRCQAMLELLANAVFPPFVH